MASIYVERLIKRVIELSQSSDWDTAVAEWEIADCEEDDTLSESCVCGKEHLYYLFTIENAINGNTLFPIGSSCIKKFGRETWTMKLQFERKCLNCTMQLKTITSFLFHRNSSLESF